MRIMSQSNSTISTPYLHVVNQIHLRAVPLLRIEWRQSWVLAWKCLCTLSKQSNTLDQFERKSRLLIPYYHHSDCNIPHQSGCVWMNRSVRRPSPTNQFHNVCVHPPDDQAYHSGTPSSNDAQSLTTEHGCFGETAGAV